MILLLSLLARAGHGKSTVANYLTKTYGAKKVSLGDPLKKAAKACMGFSDEQLWGTQAQKEAIDPRYGFSCRKFLQLLGTEGLRKEFGENIHLDTLVKHVDRGELNALYIVDDTRFLNEVTYFNELGVSRGPWYMRGATIKIVCTDAPPMPGAEAQHASEQEIDRIPDGALAGTVVSSRAQGVKHLIVEVEMLLATVPALQAFRALL